MYIYKNMHSEIHIYYYRFSDTISNKLSPTNAIYIAPYICSMKEEEHDRAPFNSYFLKVVVEIQEIEEMEINTILTHDQQIMS